MAIQESFEQKNNRKDAKKREACRIVSDIEK